MAFGGTITTVLSFTFLTGNTILGLCRAKDDASAMFVAAAFQLLLLFLWSVHKLERPAPGSDSPRGRQTALVWLLAAALINGMFSYWVAGMMPPAVAAAVWALCGITTAAEFYVCFLYGKKERSRN